MIENITTKDLFLLLLPLFQDLVQPFDGIGGNQALHLTLHEKEVFIFIIESMGDGITAFQTKVALVLYLLVLRLAIVLTHPFFCLRHRIVSHGTQTTLLDLTVIFRLYAPNLLNVHAVLHELGNNLCLRRTSLMLLNDKLNHLVIRHG